MVELLVALAFTAVLMVGMMRVFAASVSNFHTTAETVGVQRASRWALNRLQDDALQAGYLFPMHFLSAQLQASSTAQAPLLFQQTAYAPSLVDALGATVTFPQVDELQFVMDLPMDVDAKLKTGVAAGASEVDVTINYGGGLIKPGDVLFMLDSSYSNKLELLKIKTIAGNGPTYSIKFETANYGGFQPELNAQGVEKEGSGMVILGAFSQAHKADSPLTFIRPDQVVRYTVVPRSLDPSDTTKKVPCLVRQIAPLSAGTILAGGSAPDFAAPAGSEEQILSEGVAGFRVDISLDGGKTFLRSTLGQSWPTEIYSALDTQVASLTSPIAKQIGGIKNPKDLCWFNYVPVLLRLEVETPTQSSRTEYSATGNAVAFRTRKEVLMVSPRNFALGAPY